MKLVVGLGNPGKEYEGTRHNVGFEFLDFYLNYKNVHDKWVKKADGVYLSFLVHGEKVIFFKPYTFMNLSGNAVRKIMDYFKIDISDLLIVSDDLDLLIGNYKLKASGSSGGHNGLKSIESCIGSCDYKRLKIGISKNNQMDTKDYVLGHFSTVDKNILNDLFQNLCIVMDDYFNLPFGDLMSKYNHKNR